ncbi:LysR family transcriptional regulator [Pigmentiphaga kullae]|uniref:DNA-binding transcriptional LysR family regulator n=1 Tax=Pigmentiphaga kullae TaxID=151784 RepID=A0A4Q7NLQ9_9BURK|nr:LysR substrate-binding domain-containing protein [Pigmentiphaga kullae]RZS85888.1 DNA-binding transcriptional LysR family regulator [Pigmentiphaga kullae]
MAMDWTRRLRIRQLEVLSSLADTCNLSHTADRLSMTQPALSKWLAELETELGVPLFERHSRGLVPTRFGAAMAEHARIMLAEVERASQAMALMAEGADGHLSIGVTATVSTGLLPDSVALLLSRRPETHLSITESTLDQLLPPLLERRLDFVVTRLEGGAIDDRLRCTPVYSESIAVAAPPTHPLAGRSGLAWADLDGCGWVVPPEGNPLRRELDAEFALAGLPAPRYRVEAVGILMLVAMMQRANLLTALSRRVLDYFQSAGHLVALDLPTRRQGTVGILRHRDAPDTALHRDFHEALLQAADAAGVTTRNRIAGPPASK